MLSDILIEQRLSTIENSVAEIQRLLASEIPALSWVERFTGSFKDDPAFAEVVAYGRTIRWAYRPRG